MVVFKIRYRTIPHKFIEDMPCATGGQACDKMSIGLIQTTKVEGTKRRQGKSDEFGTLVMRYLLRVSQIKYKKRCLHSLVMQ